MNRAILCIGSNLEPREMRIRRAVAVLDTEMADVTRSDIYETPEVHGAGRPYLNMVMAAATSRTLEELTAITKRIEHDSGRDEESRLRGDVPVDIDIVVWNGTVLRPGDAKQTFFRIGARMIGEIQD